MDRSSTLSEQRSKGDDLRQPLKKRNRPVLSCVVCHERRVKCNRGHPCESCIAYGTVENCTYAARPNKRQHTLPESQPSRSYPEKPLVPFQLPISINDAPAREEDGLIGKAAPLKVFTSFVERFQSNSAPEETAKAPDQCPYPPEALLTINSFRRNLPTIEKAELLLTFFKEQLDWMYLVGDFDSMDKWFLPLLERLTQMTGPLIDGSLKRLDATKIALIISCFLSSIQIANEGLTKIFFLDTDLNTRQDIIASYEPHLRTILGIATQYDGSNPDLIRASLIYFFYLKNGGHQGGEEASAPLMGSITQLIRVSKLHQDPSLTLPEYERESRRRLFWTYFTFDRISSVKAGRPVSISYTEITTREPQEEYVCQSMGRRINWCLIYKARMFHIIEPLLVRIQKESLKTEDIEEYDSFFTEWVRSLPDPLKPGLPRLESSFQRVRAFDLERHLLQATYYTSRGALHRFAFFPSETISFDQVARSRQICIDSALAMIDLQERLRIRCVSDCHLRCSYVPLFTLESSITLILASLIELSNTPSGEGGVPIKVREYMRWAHRGRDLLVTIPADFTAAIQAVKLVSRVLSKATRIIDLHALQIGTRTDSKTAIRDVLCDDDGKQVSIPFLEQSYSRRGTGIRAPTLNATAISNSDYKGGSSTSTTSSEHPTPLSSDNTGSDMKLVSPYPSSSFSHLLSSARSDNSNNQYGASANLGVGEPTYAEMGLDFFNDLAAALKPADNINQQHPIFFDQHPPMLNSHSLDDQMDLWLASLQNIV